MTRRIAGGYAFRQAMTTAMNSNRAARRALRRIIDEDDLSRNLVVLLAARALSALGENLDALVELERIVTSDKGAGDQDG